MLQISFMTTTVSTTLTIWVVLILKKDGDSRKTDILNVSEQRIDWICGEGKVPCPGTVIEHVDGSDTSSYAIPKYQVDVEQRSEKSRQQIFSTMAPLPLLRHICKELGNKAGNKKSKRSKLALHLDDVARPTYKGEEGYSFYQVLLHCLWGNVHEYTRIRQAVALLMVLLSTLALLPEEEMQKHKPKLQILKRSVENAI